MKHLLSIVALIVLLTPQPTFAVWKYIGGAELNSITDDHEVTTNSAPIATTSAAVHSGSYAWRVNGGAGFQRHNIFNGVQAATSTTRIWYYPVARPDAQTVLLRYARADNVRAVSIEMLTDGTLIVTKSNGAQLGSASSALPLNEWSCIELQNDSTQPANSGIVARLNEVEFASGPNANTGLWARVVWGNATGVQTTNDGYFDDVAIISNQTGFVGCGSTVFMKPNAAGDANGWQDTAGAGGTSNNYTLVNDFPPNDATSFVATTTANAEDLYNFSASGLQTYDTINALGIGSRHVNSPTTDAATAYKLEWMASSGGTKALGSAIVPNSTTWSSFGTVAGVADSFTFATTTDTTGAALTSTVLDSMQAGFILSTAATDGIRVTNLWAYADYTPGTPPAGGSRADDGIIWFTDD